jgi:hypothetical protein
MILLSLRVSPHHRKIVLYRVALATCNNNYYYVRMFGGEKHDSLSLLVDMDKKI